MSSVRNPGSTCCRLIKVRTVKPAPINSMNDTATCTTIRPLRSPCDVWVDRVPAPSDGVDPSRPASAGTVPNTSPVRDRHHQREEQHRPVDRDFGRAARESLGERDQQFDAPDGQHQAERAADDGQQRALGEQLPQQPRAAGAERRADRHLALAPHHSREREVGDARADDQQNEAGRPEQHEQRRFERARELLLQRDGDGLIALADG